MHSLIEYLWMVGDPARVDPYTAAIQTVVRRGDRVIDLGAGFGYFSVIAARAGASHVDAIEMSRVVHLGPRLAEANGCADRIVFHAGDAAGVELPDRADVLVADLRRQTPFARRSIATVIDVRDRLLRPGGTIVAARDTLMAAPCRAPQAFRRDVRAAADPHAMDLSAVTRVVLDTPLAYHVEAEALLAAGAPWGVLDYPTISSTDYSGEAGWTFAADTTVEGIAVWFESELAPGVRLSCAPGAPGHTYGQLFLPFQQPLVVAAGARIRVGLAARTAGPEYVWQWETWLQESGGERQVSAQNSLADTALDPAALAAANSRSG